MIEEIIPKRDVFVKFKFSNFNVSDEAKVVSDKMISGNLYKYRKLVLFLYIILLLSVLIILWTSLLSLVIIGVVLQPKSDKNESRPHFEALTHTLTNNPQYLPERCHSNKPQMWNANVSRQGEILCPEVYVFDCSKCVPICGLWHPYGSDYYIGYRVLAVIVAIGNVIVSVLGIITLSCVKGMFKYPQIVYFLMFVLGFIYSIFHCGLAIPGPYYAFCGARNEAYKVVVNNPPIQVNVVGSIISYLYLSFNLWFMFATINVFIQVYFPTFRFFNRTKFRNSLFIIALIVCFGLPIVPPVLTFSIYGHYIFIRTPQIPIPKNWIIFILLFVDWIGITLLAFSVFKSRVHKLSVTTEGRQTKINSFELRLIILSFFLWITVMIVLVEVSIQLYYKHIVHYLLEDYWSCLTLQLNPFLGLVNQTAGQVACVTRYRDYVYPIFNYIADFSLGMWAILLFVVLTTKESRDVWKRAFKFFVPLFRAAKLLNNTGLEPLK